MKELKYSWRDRYCCRCMGREPVGKILRTLVIISNILYWFAGCAILSVAIWLRFVDVGTKDFFSTFHPVDTALYVVLVASILFLVASFVGTCAANTKNEMMLTLYIAVVFVVSLAEVVSLVVYSSSHFTIERDFTKWYKGHFERYQEVEVIHRDAVNHIQAKMKCCGMSGPRDYVIVFGNESIPNSCILQIEVAESIYRPDIYTVGCLVKLNELITWLLKGWPVPFVATIILSLQVAGIASSSLFLQHIIYRKKFNYDDDKEESSDLIDSSSNIRNPTSLSEKQLAKTTTDDLPRPKLFRVVKSPVDDTHGFDIGYNGDRNCYVITYVQTESNAEYAGLSKGSQVIELNGLLLQGIDQDEVYEKLERMISEVFLVTVDEETERIYKSNKVAVNLRNLEGVTNEILDYKPRLCKLKKGRRGFGFHLLYLEDRSGEYIEEVAAGSPAHESGLSVGDRIIDVNGVNIEREKSSEVVKQIRMSGDTVSLLVVDPKTDGFFRKKGVTLSASLSIDYYAGRAALAATVPRMETRRNVRDVKPRYCRLVKSEREDFGLYVVIDNVRIGQVIRWVDCGGPADRAGLRIGDRIVEVNGHSVEYESHHRLISCISINKTSSHFIVVDEDYDRVYKRNKPRLCRIFKESGSFGFCVRYEQNKDGHYIEEVDRGGPADRAGLQVNDRLLQLDGMNVERESHQNVLSRLRACESNVVLLIIDARSNKHYKRIVKFKSEEMKDFDFDAVSTPEEPLFLREDSDSVTLPSDQISMGVNDSISTRGSQSRRGVQVALMGDDASSISTEHQGHRGCVVRMARQEKQGFALVVDRDRNGLIVKDLVRGGPGDRAGLKDGDRITIVNGQKVSNLNHDEVLDKIQQSGRRFTLTVVDEGSDELSIKHRPYLFRITKDAGGYGFYLWYDDNGHYVEEITFKSPADQSGMRSGDRIIEVNGVNVEEETHEEVFYRVKASVNAVTLLVVDQKTFRLYKKHKIPVRVLKAETNFSSDLSQCLGPNAENKVATTKKTLSQDIELYRVTGGDFGFNLAYSNSFIEDSNAGSHIVHWVDNGGPAYEAGLRNGDKIIAVEGTDVTDEDQDQVIARIYQVGKQTAVLTIEYEEEQDAFVPHIINIRKTNNSFGFHLWFDQNGHFIEDVTIGSASDNAGLKVGDRVLKVNGKEVDESSHADVVELVRQRGDQISLEVLSVQHEDVGDFSTPTVCTLLKERGTFGFTLSQDDNGIHFDYVAAFSPAEKMGISVGDRLLEVGGEPISGMDFGEVVSKIRRCGSTVTFTVISTGKNIGSNRVGDAQRPDSFSNQIFNELSGKDKIDFVVEKKRFGIFGGTADNDSLPSEISGKDNPVFVSETEDSPTASPLADIMNKDIKGRFLDEKILPQACSQATMRRRKPGKRRFVEPRPGQERRNRSLLDIKQKLGNNWNKSKPPSDSQRVTYKKELASQPKRENHFRLVTSKTALRPKWNFEEGDSRRPGEIKNVFVGDSIVEEEQVHQSANNSDNDDAEYTADAANAADVADAAEVHSVNKSDMCQEYTSTLPSESFDQSDKDNSSVIEEIVNDDLINPVEVRKDSTSIDVSMVEDAMIPIEITEWEDSGIAVKIVNGVRKNSEQHPCQSANGNVSSDSDSPKEIDSEVDQIEIDDPRDGNVGNQSSDDDTKCLKEITKRPNKVHPSPSSEIPNGHKSDESDNQDFSKNAVGSEIVIKEDVCPSATTEVAAESQNEDFIKLKMDDKVIDERDEEIMV